MTPSPAVCPSPDVFTGGPCKRLGCPACGAAVLATRYLTVLRRMRADAVDEVLDRSEDVVAVKRDPRFYLERLAECRMRQRADDRGEELHRLFEPSDFFKELVAAHPAIMTHFGALRDRTAAP